MNKALLAMIERHEGRRNKPYRCPAGRPTIGIGHNMEAKPLSHDMQAFLEKHGYITDGMVDQLLLDDIATAIIDASYAVGKAAWLEIGEARQSALIDMAFNLGGEGLRKFGKFIANIRHHDWEKAAAEIRSSKYYRQLGGDPAGTDDGILERPEEIMQIIRTGAFEHA